MAWPDDYNLNQFERVTIHPVTGMVSDVDVLVLLSDLSTNTQTALRSDGGDARWTLDDGTTQLARATLLDSSGDAYGWRVKVPTLASATDTVIRLYVNGIDAEPTTGSTYGRDAAMARMLRRYTFDQAPGGAGTLTDLAGNEDATPVNSPTLDDGGWVFDGVNDYATATGPTLGGGNDFTLLAEFTLASKAAGEAIASAAGSAGWFLQLGGGVNPISFCSAFEGEIDGSGSTVPSETGRRYRVAGISFGATDSQHLYIDGTLAGRQPDGAEIASLAGLDIGRRGDGVYADATIYSISIFPEALSADEIAVRYNNEASPSTFYSTEWVSEYKPWLYRPNNTLIYDGAA